jgi:hypothetical protein
VGAAVPLRPVTIGKDEILAELRRCAAENGGTPPGRQRFQTLTGIRETDWLGIHWVRWSDAVIEAGFVPNGWQGRYTDEQLLSQLATCACDLGRFPTFADLKMRRRQDDSFPSHGAFARLGRRGLLIERLAEWCEGEPSYSDVRAICLALLSQERSEPRERPVTGRITGHVYLIKSGKYYKIGQTTNWGRRTDEIGRQQPTNVELVHTFATDDPDGIEGYWHKRFEDRKVKGEWFLLKREDVAAFKLRKRFM